MTPWQLFLMGGWVMWPILATSVMALGVVFGRLAYFLRGRGDPRRLVSEVLVLASEGRLEEWRRHCEASRLPVARLLRAGLDAWPNADQEFERQLERAAEDAVAEAEVGLPTLATALALLPMLGFLGTILGLIDAFLSWKSLGASATIDQLSGGIAAAMITTGAGLLASIPYTVAYNAFAARVAGLARSLNAAGADLAARHAAAPRASVTPLRQVEEA